MRFYSIFKKEILQFFRNRLILFVVLYSFTLDVIIAGRGFNLEVKRVPFSVMNEDGSNLSLRLIDKFKKPYFIKRYYLRDQKDIKYLFDHGKILFLLAIPYNFSSSIYERKSAKLQIIADGTDSAIATKSVGYALKIIDDFSKDLERRVEKREEPRKRIPFVDTKIRVWFNKNLKSEYFMALSEFFSILTLVCILLPATSLVREKEEGTIEQILVTPTKVWEMLLAKLLSISFILIVFVILCIEFVLFGFFKIPMRGSFLLFILATLLYIYAASGIGIFVASFSKNLSEAVLITILIITPILFLSGSWTPYEMMPYWMKILTYLSPLKYYLSIGFGIFLKGIGLKYLLKDFLGLTIMGSILFYLSIKVFKF